MSKRVDSSKDISILAGLARAHTGDGGAQAPLDDIEVAQRMPHDWDQQGHVTRSDQLPDVGTIGFVGQRGYDVSLASLLNSVFVSDANN